MAGVGKIEAWVRENVARLLCMDVNDSEELAACVLAMPCATDKEEREIKQLIKEFLGSSAEVETFATELVQRRRRPGEGVPVTERADEAKGGTQAGSDIDRRGKSGKRQNAKEERGEMMKPPGKAVRDTTAQEEAEDDFWGTLSSTSLHRSDAASACGGRQDNSTSGKRQGRMEDKAKSQSRESERVRKGKNQGGGGRAVPAASGGGRDVVCRQPLTASPTDDFAYQPSIMARPAPLPCRCMGTCHTPLGNCLRCGKVICSKEGWTICSFCKTDLTNPANGYRSRPPVLLRSLAARGKLAVENESKEVREDVKDGSERADEMRDRLLVFDLSMAERTKVYDDQADYFPGTSGNMAWMDEKECEEEERREEERREKASGKRGPMELSIDLAGRRVFLQDSGIDTGKEESDAGRIGINEAAEEVARLAWELSTSGTLEGNYDREGARKGKSGVSRLSGRAREVFEGLHAHFGRIKSSNYAKEREKRQGHPEGEDAEPKAETFSSRSRVQTTSDRLHDDEEMEIEDL